MHSDIKKKQLIGYFIFTFLISWVLWSPFYFSAEVNEFWVLLGAWGPTLSAIIFTSTYQGKSGLKGLFRKLLTWKVSIKYYVFSIFGILGVSIISIILFSFLGSETPNYSSILLGMGLEKDQLALAFLLSPLFFLINTFIGGPIAEELGWRGFAQERLQFFFSPNISGLIIGFLWALWHLPLIIFMPKAVSNMPILLYIPLLTSMGIVFSWLYNKTHGSVLLAILFHGSMNFTLGFLGADIFIIKELLIIQVLLIVIVALILSTKNKKGLKNEK